MAGYEPIETASIDNSGLCRPSDCSPRFTTRANIDHYTRRSMPPACIPTMSRRSTTSLGCRSS